MAAPTLGPTGRAVPAEQVPPASREAVSRPRPFMMRRCLQAAVQRALAEQACLDPRRRPRRQAHETDWGEERRPTGRPHP